MRTAQYYVAAGQWTRRCSKCNQIVPMQGGATGKGGKHWRCAGCKPKKNPPTVPRPAAS